MELGKTAEAASSPARNPDKAPSVVEDGGISQSKHDKDREGHEDKPPTANIGSFLRVFRYNDKMDWALNSVAFVAMIVSGTALPLMNLAFGGFVNLFHRFVTGKLSPDAYMSEVVHYTYEALIPLRTRIPQMLINTTAIRTIRNLRVDFVRQLLRQEIAFFDTQSLSVADQVTANGDVIYRGISEKLGLIVQSLSMLISAFVVAFCVQWKLSLITAVIIPMNTIIMLICVYFDTRLEGRMLDVYNTSGSLAEEALSTVRTAHAFWAFPRLVARFDAMLGEARRIGNRKSVLYAVLFPAEFFSITTGYALAFWQGLGMYSRGEIQEPGTIITVIAAVMAAAQALTQISPQIVAVSKAMAAAQNLFSTIDRVSRMDPLSEDGIQLAAFQGHIRLQGVGFSYPSRPNTPVLQDVSLEFPPNQITAIVGASGSGKSTIFGLIERWYAHSSGEITLDGHKLESFNLRWLRTNIRLVQQEPTLFSGTIYQNVMDGLAGSDAGLSDQEKRHRVVAACKAALIHDFIAQLPRGYDSWIGERGASLSGGQKQRLVIARTVISNPKVLLLDEATSALDPGAEKTVQAALNNIARGRTIVVIAHRLSTVRDSDNIIVLGKGGQVVESGTHAHLVDLGGAYASLVRTQDLAENMPDAAEGEDGSVAADEEGEGAVAVPDGRSAQASAPRAGKGDESRSRDALSNYGMLHGLFLIMKEQQTLWRPLCVSVVFCTAGGELSAG
ncbi:hypothetical protein E4U53_001080 [Claviceps sorghi]|nr:hypothetical protein E4U53_001080 [Claviceps sorghi]